MYMSRTTNGQTTVVINPRLSKEAEKAGLDMRLVIEAAIKRAIAKKSFLKQADRLLKNSKLTSSDAIALGRKVNSALARRYAIR